uniref:Uncharacterized protein n=1 Tax=Chromera velia CCMP2878 TaxID=1169474 RepID=A0A0G4GBM9_9ALVE|eukprot:Cvel_21067.t1-p1 / transcript=Cvel_21067.t1 / gene=Cvel_21067 / organism=Chromera_velia_CCMP2878 / gene_product=hypothetical protein / transcript_product=hypothetical protein / location=Cvel_scaffold1947:9659-12957(-) / protein_length=154 / sequence_SO=supercontig / SO=protein_coding / is_pseudo=false
MQGRMSLCSGKREQTRGGGEGKQERGSPLADNHQFLTYEMIKVRQKSRGAPALSEKFDVLHQLSDALGSEGFMNSVCWNKVMEAQLKYDKGGIKSYMVRTKRVRNYRSHLKPAEVSKEDICCFEVARTVHDTMELVEILGESADSVEDATVLCY